MKCRHRKESIRYRLSVKLPVSQNEGSVATFMYFVAEDEGVSVVTFSDEAILAEDIEEMDDDIHEDEGELVQTLSFRQAKTGFNDLRDFLPLVKWKGEMYSRMYRVQLLFQLYCP